MFKKQLFSNIKRIHNTFLFIYRYENDERFACYVTYQDLDLIPMLCNKSISKSLLSVYCKKF